MEMLSDADRIVFVSINRTIVMVVTKFVSGMVYFQGLSALAGRVQ